MSNHIYSKLLNMMFLALYQSIIICGLILILVTYEVSQGYYSNVQQIPFPTRAISVVEINQYSASVLGRSRPKLKAFLHSLSPLQTKDVIEQMGVSNLTLEISQQQFLNCSGIAILGGPLRSFISVPQSHQHCKKMSFKNSGPTVALGSFPGSGNSWVRQLLESATGIYTGALYCDGSYIEAGMIGEGVTTKNVIAIKTHDWPYAAKKLINHDKAIYIVRSPFGSILSEHNRYLAGVYKKKLSGNRHTSEVDLQYYNYTNNSAWENKVKRGTNKWTRIVRQWLSVKEFPVLFVGYENLMKDRYTELKRMLDFIEYPYSEDDLLCTVKSSGEGFHRNHTKKYLINPYSPELQEFVLSQIKKIDTNLQEHNISLYHPYTI